jgi:hypothetical protein
MKYYAVILIALLCRQALCDDTRLSPRFRTVYILPMGNGLDQHLASHLTSRRVLWVVLDPPSADAIMTDALDEVFWNWLLRAYPASVLPSGNSGALTNRGGNAPAPNHSGTVFLVDPRRRVILWSTYDLPKNGSPSELERSAERITNQLKAAFGKR